MPLNSRRLRSLGRCTLFFGLVLAAACQAQDSPKPTPTVFPDALLGTWQVTQVLIDTGASWRMPYQKNDPRLTGRLFTITQQRLATNTPEESKPCINPKVAVRHLTASELIKNSLAGRHTVPEAPTPKDYELPLAGNVSVDVLSVTCMDGLFAGDLGIVEGIKGAWIVALRKDQLAIRWYAETILLLHKVSDNVKPVASFDCNKAITVVEKTICGSLALAAFDQSVTRSYKSASEFFKEVKNTEALTQLKISQTQWLTQRNACGADVLCLEKAMKDRLDVIEDQRMAAWVN